MKTKIKITKDKKKDVNIINMTWHLLSVSWHIIEADWLLRISYAFLKQDDLINWKFIEYKSISWCNEVVIPKQKNTIYIVSEVACKALPHRDDLYMCHGMEKTKGTDTITLAKWLKMNPYYKK